LPSVHTGSKTWTWSVSFSLVRFEMVGYARLKNHPAAKIAPSHKAARGPEPINIVW
jgi:hypothetical protein